MQATGAAGQAGREAAESSAAGGRRTQVDQRRLRRAKARPAADGQAARTNGPYGDLDAGFKNAALVLDETFVTPDTSHQTLETRSAMAYWQNGKVFVHTGTQSTVQTVAGIARWLNMDPEPDRADQRIHRRRLRQQSHRRHFADHSGAAVEEVQCAGDDAHQPRGRAFHRPRPARLPGRMKVGFAKDGRITAVDMFVICNNGPYDAVGDANASGESFRCCISRRRCAGAA